MTTTARTLWPLLPLLVTLTLLQAVTLTQAAQCEAIQVAMCKGLVSYNNTRLPNKFGHTTQAQAYWAMQQWWPFMDAGCSDNMRTFVCGLYLPRCVEGQEELQYPCQETCVKAKVRCRPQMSQQQQPWRWPCTDLLPKASRRCVRPERERKKRHYRQYVLCEDNKLSMCGGLPYTQGSLPNMFLQGDTALIDREMQQFRPLVESGCSRKLTFFLCGAYMPYCLPGETQVTGHTKRDGGRTQVVRQEPDVPFVVPCRELCQEVYDECWGEYSQRTGGLPWPGKFHCHRYPSYSTAYNSSDTTAIPCTMPPYHYRAD